MSSNGPLEARKLQNPVDYWSEGIRGHVWGQDPASRRSNEGKSPCKPRTAEQGPRFSELFERILVTFPSILFSSSKCLPMELKILQTLVFLCLEVAGGIRGEEPPGTVGMVTAAKGRGASKILGALAGKEGAASHPCSSLS